MGSQLWAMSRIRRARFSAAQCRRQHDELALFELSQHRTAGHILEPTTIGTPVPHSAQLNGTTGCGANRDVRPSDVESFRCHWSLADALEWSCSGSWASTYIKPRWESSPNFQRTVILRAPGSRRDLPLFGFAPIFINHFRKILSVLLSRYIP